MVQKETIFNKLGISRIRNNFKEWNKNTNVTTDPQPVRGAVPSLAADSYVRLHPSDGQSSATRRLLLQLSLRLGDGSPELPLIEGQRRKYTLWICKLACCCPYTAFLSVCRREGPWGCCAMTEEADKDSICRSWLSRRSTCLLTTSRSSPHISYSSQQGFSSVFTWPCQVSSQFMVSQLRQFPVLLSAWRNLEFTLKSITFFWQCQGFSTHPLLCSSLHHSDLPAARWLLRMLSLKAILLAFYWGKKSNKPLCSLFGFHGIKDNFCLSSETPGLYS